MVFQQTVKIPAEVADAINRYLTEEPQTEEQCLGEDETITFTAAFMDGLEMDIKCCGVQFEEGSSNLAYAEAVLFKNGHEICCSEPSEDYLGEWSLENDGNTYVAVVEAKN